MKLAPYILNLSLLLSGGAWAAGTPAGTTIRNQAEATYTDPSGTVQTAESEEIVTEVLPIYDFVILPDGTINVPGQNQIIRPGEAVVFLYTVTNQGNIADTILLAVEQDINDAFNLDGVTIYRDNNNNSIFDEGDTQVSSLELDPDGSAQVFVVGTVPQSAAPETFGNVNLAGTSDESGGTDLDNWARATVAEGTQPVAGVDIGNSDGDTRTDPDDDEATKTTTPGTAVSYPLELKNTGTAPDTFNLTSRLPSGLSAQIFRDTDCDGAADGAPVTTAGPLEANETVCLVVTLTTSATTPAGSTPFTVTAMSPSTGVMDSIENIITVSVATPTAGVNIGNGDENPATDPSDTAISVTTPGTPVSYPLELTNTGSAADTFDVTVSAPSGWTAQVFADENCDGEADDDTPLTVVGPLDPAENVCLVIVVTPPAGVTPGNTPVTVTATGRNAPRAADSITNTVVVTGGGEPAAGVNIGNGDGDEGTPPTDPSLDIPVAPGTPKSYRLELTNTGDVSDTFDVTVPGLPSGWTIQVFLDEACDGTADEGAALTAVGPLSPGENICVVVTVTPPADAGPGRTPVTITATSRNDPEVSDSITDTLVIEDEGSATPGLNLGNGDEDLTTGPSDTPVSPTGTPGTPTSYPLELTNTGDAADTFTLGVPNLPTGWTAVVLLDENCDGAADGGTPVTTVGPLDPGENACFVLVVTPPADAGPGSTPVTVTATSQTDPELADSITNTLVIGGGGGGTGEGRIVLSKSVSPSGPVALGETLTYTVTATNVGDAATGVIVSDALPEGTSFVSATATTTLSGAVRYSQDGVSWSSFLNPLGGGEALYVGVDTNGDDAVDAADTFGADDTLTLTFSVRVTGGENVVNQARAAYGGQTTSSETLTTPVGDDLSPNPEPEPEPNPEPNPEPEPTPEPEPEPNPNPEPQPALCAVSVTPDGTVSSPGQRVQASAGETVYLPYTVTNTGEGLSDDSFELSATTLLDSAGVGSLRVVLDENGNGRVDGGDEAVTRLGLTKGESAEVLLEVALPSTPGTFYLNLAAACVGGGGETASDTINVSQVDVPAVALAVPQKTAVPAPGEPLYAGAAVAYTVTFTAAEALQNVVVRDTLAAELALPTLYTTGTVTDPVSGLSAEAVAALDGRTLTWTFAAVPAGMTVTLNVETTVADGAALSETVENTACVGALGALETCSAPVTHPLAPVELGLSKTALVSPVSVGGTLPYKLVATNTSEVVPLANGVLVDTLPEGLVFEPGTAVRVSEDGATEPFEPSVTTNVLRWTLPTLLPGDTLTVRFDTRVTTAALGYDTLLNRAELDALGSDGKVVAAERDEAEVVLEAGILRARSVLMGHLYLDADGSEDFSDGDKAVANTRLYLSNGLSVVSDPFGRYTVTDLPAGLLALRLDPTTTRNLELLDDEPTETKTGLWRVRLHPGLITRQDIGFVAPPARPRTQPRAAVAPKPVSAAEQAARAALPDDLPASPVETLTGVNIVAPEDGLLLRGRSSTPIVVETPLGDVVTLTVDGQVVPSSLLGKRVLDEARGRQRFEYAGVRFEPGDSEVVVSSRSPDGTVTETRITVAAAGPAARVTIRSLGPLAADSAAPLAFGLRLEDENGYAPQDDFVTLVPTGAEIASEDANKRLLGFQVRTREGRARFSIRPLPVPASIGIRAEIGTLTSEYDFAVRSAQRPWVAAAAGSVGASYRPGEPLAFGASGTLFARGSLAGQLLTFGVRYPQGVYGSDPFSVLPSEGVTDSASVTGSSTNPTTEARSADGVFARLENDLSFVQYGDLTTDLLGPLLSGSRELTGLSGRYAEFGGGLEVRGYGSLSPQAEEVLNRDVPSNGTSLYRLPEGLESLTVVAVTKDELGALTGQRELVLGRDYAYTPETGQLLLNEPLPLQNTLRDRFFLRLSYRFPAQVGAERLLEAGAQVAYDAGALKPRVGAVQAQNGASTVRTVSAGVAFEEGGVRAEADVAYGGDESASGAAAALNARLDGERLDAEASYRYTAPGYRSSALSTGGSAGHEATFGVSYDVSATLNVSANATAAQGVAADERLRVRSDLLGRLRLGDAGFLGSDPELQLGAEFEGGTPRALAGFRVGTPFGLAGADLSVLHRQGLGGPSETDFGVRYRLLENLSLTVTEQLTWGLESDLLVGLETGFDNAALLGDDTYRGRTSVSTQYELPGGVSAEAGRARLGLRTQLPLNDVWSVDGSLEQLLDLTGDDDVSAATFGTTVDTDDLDAEASYQFSLEGGLVRHLLSAGTNFRANDGLFGGANALVSLEPGATEGPAQGFSLNVAGAYRSVALDILTSHTARFGSLAPEDGAELTGDLRAALPLGVRFDLRGSYLYRSEGAGGLVDLTALGATFYPWGGGGVGLYGQLFHLWNLNDFLPGLGLEVSQEVVCGLYAVGGYNFGGLTDPLGPGYGGSGFFIRVDLVADERFSCDPASSGTETGGAR